MVMSKPSAEAIGEYDVVFDLKLHKATLFGDGVVFGWEYDGLVIDSSRLLEMLDPSDTSRLLDAIERSAELRPGERVSFELRFRTDDHEKKFIGRIECRTERFVRGRTEAVRAKVRWFEA